MLPNSPEFVECWRPRPSWACPRLNLNWHLRADEVAWILDDSGAGALVTHVDLRDQVEAVVRRPRLPVLWVGGDYDDGPGRRVRRPTSPYRWPTSWPVIYTSGTSGRPKGVVHGAAADPAIMEMAHDGLAALWGYPPDDVHLVAGPLYHAGPCGLRQPHALRGRHAWWSWTAGTPASFLRPRRARTAPPPPSSPRPTSSASSRCPTPSGRTLRPDQPAPRHPRRRALPAAGQGAHHRGLPRRRDLGAVRRERGRRHPRLVRRLAGPTRARSASPGPASRSASSTPTPLEPVAAGDDGLIYVRPAQGRFELPQRSRPRRPTPGATTPSRGRHRPPRRRRLALPDRPGQRPDHPGRASTSTRGRSRRCCTSHPAVVDCAVFGVPDDRDGEQPVAVVEARRGRSPCDELDALVPRTASTPTSARPHSSWSTRCPAIPNGKVLKRLLRDQAWAGTGRRI